MIIFYPTKHQYMCSGSVSIGYIADDNPLPRNNPFCVSVFHLSLNNFVFHPSKLFPGIGRAFTSQFQALKQPQYLFQVCVQFNIVFLKNLPVTSNNGREGYLCIPWVTYLVSTLGNATRAKGFLVTSNIAGK